MKIYPAIDFVFIFPFWSLVADTGTSFHSSFLAATIASMIPELLLTIHPFTW
jgi:hypothetical protein